MESGIYGLIMFVVLALSVFIVYRFDYKKNKKNSSISSSNKTNKEKIIETKTIRYMDGDTEKTITFDIIKNNGGILTLPERCWSLADVYSASFSRTPNTKALGAGGILGTYDSCINKNNLCFFGREGMYNDFYIDVNDLAKIEVEMSAGEPSLCNDDDDFEFNYISMIFYTKSGTTTEKIYYEICFQKEDAIKYLDLIKKENKDIVINYKHKFYMTKNNSDATEYNFGPELNIKNYSTYNEKIVNVYHEINIKYSDIVSADISNDYEWLSVIINDKNHTQYILFFEDDELATKFYNELKNH